MTPTHSADAAPSHVRYQVVGLATLMAVLLYLDRYCLTLIEGFIREDLSLSKPQTDLLFAIFFLTYAAAQVPAGWLSDRHGARAMLALYILGWSLFTGLMGVAQTFLLLLLCRAGCGLFQAGAYPTSAAVVSKWVPLSARGLASGIVSTGGRIGGAIAPVLTAYLLVAFVPVSRSSLLRETDLLDRQKFEKRLSTKENKPADAISDLVTSSPAERAGANLLKRLNELLKRRDLYQIVPVQDFPLPGEATRLARIPDSELTDEQVTRRNRLLLEVAFPEYIRKVYGQGWWPIVLIYGLAGVLVAGWFFWSVRNRPEDHPRCNAGERALIELDRPAASSPARAGSLPLRAILENKSLWCSALSQFGTNFGWIFLLWFVPRYLEEVHKVPVVERGWMTSLPITMGMFGMFAGGWLTDRLTQALGLRWGRRLPMAATRFTAMAAYLACLFLDSPWAATAAFCVVAVSTDLGTPAIWAFKQDIGGKYVGSVLGWGNMWGNLGAFVAPVVIGELMSSGSTTQWNLGFLACAAAFAFSGLTALGVDSLSPLRVPEDARPGSPHS
jgi:MFS family permease